MRGTDGVPFAARALLAAALAGAGLGVLAEPASSAPAVMHQAWARTGAAAPVAAEDGRIYVSVVGGQEQARSFLDVDVSDLAPGDASESRIVLQPATDSLAADQAALVGCALAEPLTASGELSGAAPRADCGVRVALTRAGDGTWSLPLDVFAGRSPGAPRIGVAIVADPAAGPNVFTVSFDTTATRLVAPVNAAGPDVVAPLATEVAPPVPSGTLPPVAVAQLEPLDSRLPVPVPTDAASASSAGAGGPGAAAPVGAVVTSGSGDDGTAGAARPSPAVLLVPVLVTVALLWAWSRTARNRAAARGPVMVTARAAWPAIWLAVAALLSFLGETVIYKLGIVAIAFIATVGLHLLVNWCGELSLAHAAFIGVPAFAVAQFSSHSGLSPLLGLPLALLVGVGLGSLVAIVALRSRGLQVALVTLAIGIATGQFLFFQSWVVGPPEGLAVPRPSLLGVELHSSRSLVPVLATAVLLAVLCARAITGSTIGRAFLHVRSDPDAAAAAGVAVARHRGLAYAVAGGFAGLAGWCYVIWVQQVSARAFPLQLGFTYLVIAALAGPGGLAGVALAALLIQGGALFSILPHTVALYLAPVALIVNVTRYPAGFNGLLRQVRTGITTRRGASMERPNSPAGRADGGDAAAALSLGTALGVVAIVSGFAAIGLAWYHMGNTDQVWIQNQELVSGGVLGLGLIVVGSALLVRDGLRARVPDGWLASGVGAGAEPTTPTTVVVEPVAPAQPESVPVNGRRPHRAKPLVVGSRP